MAAERRSGIVQVAPTEWEGSRFKGGQCAVPYLRVLLRNPKIPFERILRNEATPSFGEARSVTTHCEDSGDVCSVFEGHVQLDTGRMDLPKEGAY